MDQTPQAPTLHQWQALYDDRAGLIKDPEGRQAELIELAQALRARGVIEVEALAELLEQADAAFAWGVEAQLTDELNRKEPHA